ncbi:MAG: hypothetical protein QF408_14005 [Pirellulales bacterium]|jgi:hypothetical protein|nr:hypothetical protein [Pirellulales bacterium]HJN66960.1 hypothetical protein [Pirellulales bacterium]
MGWYSEIIFPRIYNWLIDTPHWAKYRTEQLATVGGAILEIGVGTNMKVRKWQRRLNGLQKRLVGGCRLDVDVRGLLESQSFGSLEIDNFYMEKCLKRTGICTVG